MPLDMQIKEDCAIPRVRFPLSYRPLATSTKLGCRHPAYRNQTHPHRNTRRAQQVLEHCRLARSTGALRSTLAGGARTPQFTTRTRSYRRTTRAAGTTSTRTGVTTGTAVTAGAIGTATGGGVAAFAARERLGISHGGWEPGRFRGGQKCLGHALTVGATRALTVGLLRASAGDSVVGFHLGGL